MNADLSNDLSQPPRIRRSERWECVLYQGKRPLNGVDLSTLGLQSHYLGLYHLAPLTPTGVGGDVIGRTYTRPGAGDVTEGISHPPGPNLATYHSHLEYRRQQDHPNADRWRGRIGVSCPTRTDKRIGTSDRGGSEPWQL